MRILKAMMVLLSAALLFTACSNKREHMKQRLTNFIKKHDSLVIPVSKELNLAYWNAAISGKEEDFKRAESLSLQLTAVLSDSASLTELKEIKVSGLITDSLLNRQMDVLYRLYKMAEADTSRLNEIIRMQTQIEMKYTTFRTELNGKKLTDNDVEEILRESKDVKLQEAVWIAQKKIGREVADDIRELVKKRNEVAKDLGFRNYHEMSLTLSDQDPKEVKALFDELDTLTKKAFLQVKGDIDDYLVNYYGLKSKEDLMPWNYQNRFFQEAPRIYDLNLNVYYKDKDLEKLTATYYAGIGLPIESILQNSDLYEKEGKMQHAFCTDIDQKGDVRVLCNIKPNSYWMNTMLHEFGHAVYDFHIDTTLPFALREPAHTFTTEAIAMIFGRFSSNPQWIRDMVGINEEEKMMIAENSFKTLRLEQLVFSRWAQVMYRFEREMYKNPDLDLNKLWWDLAEEYQLLKRPGGRDEPDWATKIHIATFPCYYHNYLMGELLASQLYYYIVGNVLKSDDYRFQSFAGRPEVGNYLKEKVFKPGNRYYWNDMIAKATGEKLTAKYYAKQFVE